MSFTFDFIHPDSPFQNYGRASLFPSKLLGREVFILEIRTGHMRRLGASEDPTSPPPTVALWLPGSPSSLGPLAHSQAEVRARCLSCGPAGWIPPSEVATAQGCWLLVPRRQPGSSPSRVWKGEGKAGSQSPTVPEGSSSEGKHRPRAQGPLVWPPGMGWLWGCSAPASHAVCFTFNILCSLKSAICQLR